ncbi:DNA/RNA non-specific endonuclease [Xylella taiwanensis]|uniref:Endonuclease n=1 Tax=Xylella taiwanensis TaxID=1444770 RepID=A0ABS8TXF7_9GAMM|nr:DNA/RNA non-specific endonuclease [Xylella taiwanensis]MCD8456403.1 DNA/RNA non-specific endonuclease [Xylella taiwanensis]MCD8458811.1 DNA/RNA non-specific endonuclease [Xylella taiwanensis]MCD8460947.1 DNA/RNA non-specific endonuclease [Xylella taiwanensis]MCD8462992.1 DNA/RNA non-specific endonuclease [Xylella taiwanensis]MCD8465455.1 DNA/RNA non-specific endonuclease [Xylella taiwanensis]
MYSALRVCLFLFLFVLFQDALAATRCPTLYLDGKSPTLSAVLTNRTTEVCYKEYVLLASGVTKGPVYSAERLTAQQVTLAKSIDRVGSFHEETGIPAADRSKSSDYTNSNYDRGHMTPAGDASTVVTQKQTFSMANVVPQNHTLNTGKWADIEEAVRQLAEQKGEIYIVTGPAFGKGIAVTIGASQVRVPSYVWKAVYQPNVGAAAYLCSNDGNAICNVISINQLITITGVDPFPALSESTKADAVPLPMQQSAFNRHVRFRATSMPLAVRSRSICRPHQHV